MSSSAHRSARNEAADETLMERYADGDPEAFEELFRRYEPRAFCLLRAPDRFRGSRAGPLPGGLPAHPSRARYLRSRARVRTLVLPDRAPAAHRRSAARLPDAGAAIRTATDRGTCSRESGARARRALAAPRRALARRAV